MKNVKTTSTAATNTFKFDGLKEITDITKLNNMENVICDMKFENGYFCMKYYELPPLTRNEEKMLEVSTKKISLGDRVETMMSEIELLTASDKVFYWNEDRWTELSTHDYSVYREYEEEYDFSYDFPAEYIEEESKTDPYTWATSNGYIGEEEPVYRIKKDGKHAIYVRPEGDDYVIAGYHIVFEGFGIHTKPYDRFINTYHNVYGGHDTWCYASEDTIDDIGWKLELPEPIYTTIYSKSCFQEFCLDILGDSFEVIYLPEAEPEEEPENKKDFLIEMAPEDCNSLMCEINADEIDCNIRTLYDMGKIAFTDGYAGGGCYVYDSEGNIIEYRIPVFRIAEYELDGTKYTAFEVDSSYQLWLYEHNGFIGNQYGYWHVPMDATKAVFEEFRRIFG